MKREESKYEKGIDLPSMARRYFATMMVIASSAILSGCANGNYYSFSFPSGGIAVEDNKGVRPSGALAIGEKGDIAESGRGFSIEGRAIDVLQLPAGSGIRISYATVGARYTAFSLYAEGRRSTGSASINGNMASISYGPDIKVAYQVLGAGSFFRTGPASWTIHGGAKDDPVSVYEPYLEGGFWLRTIIPTMLGPGLEFSAGSSVSRDAGAFLFLRFEVFLGQSVVCHGQKGC